MMETNNNKYRVIVISPINIILTGALLYITYAINTYLFTGFLPSIGYLILGYGLGYCLPPMNVYSYPYTFKTKPVDE